MEADAIVAQLTGRLQDEKVGPTTKKLPIE